MLYFPHSLWIVAASGVGLISGPSGTTLGHSKAKIVRIGDECRVVVATQDLEAIIANKELLRLLRTTHKARTA